MSWYKTGSITVTNGSAAVTGSGTSWVDVGTLNVGDMLYAPDGKLYEILTIGSNTGITLASNYLGTSLSGQSYAIMPIGLLPSALAQQVKTTLSTANTALASAVRFDASQSLTSGQQLQARTNIAALAAVDVGYGYLSKSVAGNTDVTLSATEAANQFITLTGALTGNINVIVPAAARLFFISNATSGAYTVTVKTASGTGLAIKQSGGYTPLECDATNVVNPVGSISGNMTISGDITLSGTAKKITWSRSNGSDIYISSYDSDDNEYCAINYSANSGAGTLYFRAGSGADPGTNTAYRMALSSTGATITGTFDTTGNITAGANGSAAIKCVDVNSGTGNGIGPALRLRKDGVTCGAFATESWLLGASSTSNWPTFFAESGLGFKWAVNGTATISMSLSASGELYVSSTGTSATIRTLISGSNANGHNTCYFENSGNSTPYGGYIQFSGAAPNNTTQYFLQCADNAATCFTIWSNGTTTGRSDERLKKNIVESSNQLDDVMAIPVVNYEWQQSNGGTKEIGFIAQQVQAVKPGLVQEDEQGFLHVKQTPLVPILWKALQELATRVVALESASIH